MSRPQVAVVIIHDGKSSWYRPSELHVKLLSPGQAQTLQEGRFDVLVSGPSLGLVSVRDLLPSDLVNSADVECA